jgi:hypothetical protein
MSRSIYWTYEKCIKKLRKYPQIETMTMNYYRKWKKENKIKVPCTATIQKVFGNWNNMKYEVYSLM